MKPRNNVIWHVEEEPDQRPKPLPKLKEQKTESLTEEQSDHNKSWKLPLSDDILRHTLFGYCKEEDAATLACASTQFDNPKFPYRECKNARVKQLLQYISQNDEDKAVEMIKQNYALMLIPETFTETLCGQREWTKPLSALQYLAWDGNTRLRRILLEHLPDENLNQALQQIMHVKIQGTEHGKPLSVIARLAKSYETFRSGDIKCFESNRWSNTQKLDYFIHVVGKHQLHSLAHFLHWYAEFPHVPANSLAKRTELSRRYLDLTNSSSLGVTTALIRWEKYQFYKYGYGEIREYDRYKDSPATPIQAYPNWGKDEEFELSTVENFLKAKLKDLKEDIRNLSQRVKNLQEPSAKRTWRCF
ncbi:MAG: hypothetical protein ACYCQI_01335 [Gammaproteobacteria bacterium]